MQHIKHFKLSLFLILSLFLYETSVSYSQTYSTLEALEGYKTKVYFSLGNNERANIVAERMDNVLSYYNDKLKFQPNVTLLILSKDDWGKYTSFPVYGMPHCDDKREVLIIASENNALWKSFIPPLDQLSTELAEKISSVYVDEEGNLTMQPFFDLLAIHEIGHAYHFQAKLNMQRKWMGELFCNILLHTFIAENEPAQLPALTVFPQMVIAGGTETYKYTSLTDLEQHYYEIGENHPKNYGWYQSRWHAAAANIYNEGGEETFIKLWNALKMQNENMDDEEFSLLLSDKVHQSASDVMMKWDE
jgi:hypothetical protein